MKDRMIRAWKCVTGTKPSDPYDLLTSVHTSSDHKLCRQGVGVSMHVHVPRCGATGMLVHVVDTSVQPRMPGRQRSLGTAVTHTPARAVLLLTRHGCAVRAFAWELAGQRTGHAARGACFVLVRGLATPCRWLHPCMQGPAFEPHAVFPSGIPFQVMQS